MKKRVKLLGDYCNVITNETMMSNSHVQALETIFLQFGLSQIERKSKIVTLATSTLIEHIILFCQHSQI